jgi:hypothetical protein
MLSLRTIGLFTLLRPANTKTLIPKMLVVPLASLPLKKVLSAFPRLYPKQLIGIRTVVTIACLWAINAARSGFR